MTNEAIRYLSLDEESALFDFRQKIIARQNSTTPCDQDMVSSAIESLYKAAGKEAPIIFWCTGPTQLLLMPLILEASAEPERLAVVENLLGKDAFADMLNQFNSGSNRMSSFQYRYRFRTPRSTRLRDHVLQHLWVLSRFNDVFESTLRGDLDSKYREKVLSGAHISIAAQLGELFRRELDLRRAVTETSLVEHFSTLLGARTTVGMMMLPESTAVRFARHSGRLPLNAGKLRDHLNGHSFCDVSEPGSSALGLLINWYSIASASSIVSLFAQHKFAGTHLSRSLYSRSEAQLVNAFWDVAMQCWSLLCQDSVCFVCDRPSRLHTDDQNRLHHPDEPALSFGDGSRVYIWHGTPVPSVVIEHPEEIVVEMIEAERNAEVRRIMMERYGLSRYLINSRATKIHEDDFGALYRKDLQNDQPLVMVKVVNSTPELDGSFKEYFLRVPPNLRKAKDAVAWTFGLDQESYSPMVET